MRSTLAKFVVKNAGDVFLQKYGSMLISMKTSFMMADTMLHEQPCLKTKGVARKRFSGVFYLNCFYPVFNLTVQKLVKHFRSSTNHAISATFIASYLSVFLVHLAP